MTKRILMLLLALMLAIVTLFSCKIGGGGEGEGTGESEGGGGETEGSNLIYDENTQLSIILGGAELTNDMITPIYNALNSKLLNIPFVGDASAPAGEHEIVIGPTDREISKEAYRRLSRVRTEEEPDYNGITRWLIYSEGTSIAIAYDEQEENIALTAALKYFLENYTGRDALRLRDGTQKKEAIILTDYYQARDNAYIEEKWRALATAVGGAEGEALVNAFKTYYAMFSDDVIDWFANLYDPAEGGYYYANSSRDKLGFLPDIESTSQALVFMVNTGMLHRQDSTAYKDILPEDMIDEIIYFIKSRQDPVTGYFLHPQWGDLVGLSRLSRDCGWATGMLRGLGSAPTYNTPNGVDGDGIDANGNPVSVTPTAAAGLTARLGVSTATMVSKVTDVKTTINAPLWHFRSAENFAYYLKTGVRDEGGTPRDDWDIRTNSYVIGNELTAQGGQIRNYDAQLVAAGDDSIIDILVEWLAENQNPETGGWDWVDESDPDFDPYETVNGMLKIATLYNEIKVEFPNAEKACMSALDAVFIEKEPPHVCAVYNTWFAIRVIKSNISAYGGEDSDAVRQRVTAAVRARAVDGIKASAAKMAIFRKNDGSFSYTKDHAAQYSQNALVTPEVLNEGDVNATIIAIAQTTGEIWSALGYGSLQVPSYTDSDYRYYMHLLEELGPVIKDEYIYVDPAINDDKYLGTGIYKDQSLTFDGVTKVQDLIDDGRLSIVGIDGQLYIPDDLTAQRSANVTRPYGNPSLELIKNTTGDPWIFINAKDKTLWDKNDTYVFETDLCVLSGTGMKDQGNSIFQFYLSQSKKSASFWYNASWVVSTDKEASAYYLENVKLDANGKPLKMKINLEDWYNLRFVIRDITASECTVETYVNGELVHSYTTAGGIKNLGAMMVRQDWNSQNSRALLDNIYFNCINETDDVYVDTNTYIDVPDVKRGSGVYYQKGVTEGYSDTTAQKLADSGLLGQFNTGKSDIKFDADSGEYATIGTMAKDNVLTFGSTTTGDPWLNFNNTVSGGTNISNDSYVFETDFYIESAVSTSSSGEYFMFYPCKSATEYSSAQLWHGASAFIGATIYDEYCLYMYGAKDVQTRISFGKWYNLRIEIDDMRSDTATVRAYLNGVEIANYETAGGKCEIDAICARFSWNETQGLVHFDNTYFASYSDGDIYVAPNTPELGSYECGGGVNYEKSEKFDGKTATEIKDSGLLTQIGTGMEDLVFDATEGEYAYVNNGALTFGSTVKGDPWLSINNTVSGATDVGNDSYVFEMDFRFNSLTAPGGSGQYFVIYASKGLSVANLWINWTVKLDAETGNFYLYYSTNENDRAVLELGKWYNLRLEIDDVRGEATSVKTYVNNVLINSSTIAAGGCEIDSMLMRYSWNDVNAMMDIDNLYFANYEDGDDPNALPNDTTEYEGSRGTGVYYGKGALGFDGIKDTTSTDDVIFRVSDGASIANVNGDTVIKTNGLSGNQGNTVFMMQSSGSGLVFETDILFASVATTRSDNGIMTFGGTNNANAQYTLYNLALSFTLIDGQLILTPVAGSIDEGYESSVTVEIRKWNNLRYEVDDITKGSAFRLYLNGELAISGVTKGGFLNSNGALIGVDMYTNGWSTAGTVYYVDNVYVGALTEGDGGNTGDGGAEEEPEISYRGMGIYADQAETYTDKTAGGLKNEGFLSSIPTSAADVTLDATSGITYANVGSIDSDAVLSFGSTAGGDPVMKILPRSNYTSDADDSYHFETDFILNGGTYASAGQAIAIMSINSKPAEKYASIIINIVYNGENSYSILFKSSYSYFTADEVSMDLEAGKWNHLSIDFADISEAGGQVKIGFNGETVITTVSNHALTNIGSFTQPEFAIYSRWSCTDLSMAFDNTYFSNISEVVDSSYRGSGKNAEDAFNMDDLTNNADGDVESTNELITIRNNTDYDATNKVHTTQTGYAAESADGDNALKITGGGNNAYETASAFESSEAISRDGGFVYEFDIMFASVASGRVGGEVLTVAVTNNPDATYTIYNGGLTFSMVDGQLTMSYMTEYSTEIVTDKWYNIRCEFDSATSGTLRVYINGALAFTGECGGLYTGDYVMATGIEFYGYYNTAGTVFYVDNVYVAPFTPAN